MPPKKTKKGDKKVPAKRKSATPEPTPVRKEFVPPPPTIAQAKPKMVKAVVKQDPPTKGSCLIINCVDKSNQRVLADTDLLLNLWSWMGYKPIIQQNVSAEGVHSLVTPGVEQRMKDKRLAPTCHVVVIQVEERSGEMCDSQGNVLDLRDTFSYFSKTDGLKTVPKMVFLHVYKDENSDNSVVNKKESSVRLPSVRNLVIYHYIEKENNGQASMASVLRDVLTREMPPIDVLPTLNTVSRKLPRPTSGNYFWKGPVCTSTLAKPLLLFRN